MFVNYFRCKHGDRMSYHCAGGFSRNCAHPDSVDGLCRLNNIGKREAFCDLLSQDTQRKCLFIRRLLRVFLLVILMSIFYSLICCKQAGAEMQIPEGWTKAELSRAVAKCVSKRITKVKTDTAAKLLVEVCYWEVTKVEQ